MPTRVFASLTLAALAVASQGQAATPQPTLSNIQEIPVVPGPNPVARLAPDGRDGLIVEASHSDSPSADGSSMNYMVLLKGAGPNSGWEAVDLELSPSPSSDAPFGGIVMRAFPHTGEDWKRSMIFARAILNGAAATLLLVADRDMDEAETAYSPAPVQFSIFALRGDPDTDQDHFVLIWRTWAPNCYVDAQWALIETFKLAAPAGYEGVRRTTACKVPKS
jgi:hypothetical protein